MLENKPPVLIKGFIKDAHELFDLLLMPNESIDYVSPFGQIQTLELIQAPLYSVGNYWHALVVVTFVITSTDSTVELARDHAGKLYRCAAMLPAALDGLWPQTKSFDGRHLVFDQATAHGLEALLLWRSSSLSRWWQLRWDFPPECARHYWFRVRTPASHANLWLLVFLAKPTIASCCSHSHFHLWHG